MSLYTVIDLSSTVCRFCLDIKQNLTNIFESSGGSSIAYMASEILGYEVKDDEGLPDKTCAQCHQQIRNYIKFKEMVLQAHTTLIERGLLIIEKLEDDEDTIKKIPIQETSSNNFDNPCRFEDGENIIESDKEMKNWRPEYPTLIKALKSNQCVLCLEQLANNDSLQAHVDAHVAGTDLDPYYSVGEKNIYCRVCEKQYEYRFSYIEHQRQHLNIKPFTCRNEVCTLAFYSRSTLKQHEPLHAHRRFICAACGLGFKRQSDLRTHEFTHRDEGRAHACSVCFKRFKNRITLRAHRRVHVSRPKHTCPHCPKTYYTPSELSRHILSHSEEKTFSCTTCGRAYLSKSALNRHLRESCSWTTKSFSQVAGNYYIQQKEFRL